MSSRRHPHPGRPGLLAVLLTVVGVAAVGGCLALVFPYNPEHLFETQVRADCAFAFRCCLPSERSVTGLQALRDEDSCVKELLENGGATATLGLRAQEVVAAGNGEFDDELAVQCTKPGIDARYACDAEAVLAPGAADPDCIAGAARAFVIGKVDDGDTCTDDLECVDEGDCVRDAPAGDVTLEGRCRARADKGDACDERRCKLAFVCLPDESGDLRCVEPPLLEAGVDCADGRECASGFCLPEETRACSFSGDACVSDEDCAGGFPGQTCAVSSRNVCSASGPRVDVCGQE
jgi:hypothetical protein